MPNVYGYARTSREGPEAEQSTEAVDRGRRGPRKRLH